MGVKRRLVIERLVVEGARPAEARRLARELSEALAGGAAPPPSTRAGEAVKAAIGAAVSHGGGSAGSRTRGR